MTEVAVALIVRQVDGEEQYLAVYSDVGREANIARELAAWEETRPVGLTTDPVLLPLRRLPVHSPTQAQAGVLAYGAAEQQVSADTMVTFEHAARLAILMGWPSPATVGSAAADVIARLSILFYRGSQPDDPDRRGADGRPDPGWRLAVHGVARSMPLWRQRERARLRSVLDEALPATHGAPLRCNAPDPDDEPASAEEQSLNGGFGYLDPVDYLRRVVEEVNDILARRQAAASSGRGSDADLRIAPIVPEMLLGRSHGDLHGRNILVGIVDDSVRWPVLFDYEDMGTGRHIGLDAVKLEMELKTRMYDEILRVSPYDFACRVARAELRLELATERRAWAPPQPTTKRLAALRGVILQIRRAAAAALGGDRGGRPWLEEYRFLLLCYGVSCVRFGDTYNEPMLSAALISAGMAASRLTFGRTCLQQDRDELGV